MDQFFNPQPKPPKKEKKPYKGIKRSPLKPKPPKPKQIEKRKPKIVEKKIHKKKKKEPKPLNELKVFEGTPIPSRYKRNEFSDKEREKIIEARGGACLECGSPYIEFHHAKFRSGSGRGVWRNGVPLCNLHHSFNHNGAGSREYADKWRKLLEDKYGEYYYMDEWDLWLMGKIEEPDKKHLEEFMIEQEKKIREAN